MAARHARSDIARALAERLGMRPRVIPPERRALYHAAASAPSNYLVTVEGMAERARGAGRPRARGARAARARDVENWIERGATQRIDRARSRVATT